jgi:hypothetical protein
VALSLATTATTLFPDVPLPYLEMGLLAAAGVGLAGGGLLWSIQARAAGRARAGEPRGGAEAGPELADARATWRTPPPEALPRPQLTPLRRAGLLTLRAYILVAVALLVIKIISLA